MNHLHGSNRACSNRWAAWWRRRADERGVWREGHRDPTLVLTRGEMRFLSDVRGKDACVLGSGDNEVVFALTGMSAHVTSVDTSKKQLEVARERAGVLGLDVSFARTDVTDLAGVPAASLDVVYTGGHISVWVSDVTQSGDTIDRRIPYLCHLVHEL